MARLKEYNGHYCESEYEYAFIGFLEEEGWKYTSGNKISRVTKRDVLIEEDFKKFIADGNPDLTEDEVTQIYDTVRLVGAESDFAALHKVYNWMVDGIQFTPEDGIARMIPLINFEKDGVKNIFRVVNQFTVEYINNLDIENLDVFNINEQKEQMNAIVLIIAIFAYGFIIVISLIGITNVFNTINTNMRLRSKEFAMLKSIGMTKKEFNRMIRLESLFYGLKSLLIGVPLGLLGGYAIFKATGNTIMLNYSFPTMAVLISIVFVFFVVWLIMKISISKVNKQNIIETIRNDNI